jgi:hypothetical protein
MLQQLYKHYLLILTDKLQTIQLYFCDDVGI